MKRLHFKLEIFDWDIHFVQIKDKNDNKELKHLLLELDVRKCDIKHILSEVKNESHNGGEHLFNGRKRHSAILIYKTTNNDMLINLIGHEKRHCEDRILAWFDIENLETSALLAGYLAEKIYPFALNV